MKEFSYERCGHLVHAKGDGWEFRQVGENCCFTQTGKIHSLRVVKTLVKELNKLTQEEEK